MRTARAPMTGPPSIHAIAGLALIAAGCLDPGEPGNLVPRTVDEDPTLPQIEVAGTAPARRSIRRSERADGDGAARRAGRRLPQHAAAAGAGQRRLPGGVLGSPRRRAFRAARRRHLHVPALPRGPAPGHRALRHVARRSLSCSSATRGAACTPPGSSTSTATTTAASGRDPQRAGRLHQEAARRVHRQPHRARSTSPASSSTTRSWSRQFMSPATTRAPTT